MIDVHRIRPETAQALVQADVIQPIKTAITEIEAVRAALKIPDYRHRATSGGAQEALLARIKEAKTTVEGALESFRKYSTKVIEANRTLKHTWIVLAVALFAVGLFGLVWGVVKESNLILGGSAVFAGIALVWPFNNLRMLRSEEIEIQTLPDRVRAGINACMAKQALEEIAGCFDNNLKLLDRAFEELRTPSKL